ncbi:hypothetical protein [Pseudocitrobacter cyperus]|uniref:Uncharacterized protein n=1 Tax=Pseudocitrobacter cyperus TaxID=3112843 RepID=A0ABV0HE84_9ENTR
MGDMKKILRILRALKAFRPLFNNRVFRVFLGVAMLGGAAGEYSDFLEKI